MLARRIFGPNIGRSKEDLHDVYTAVNIIFVTSRITGDRNLRHACER
jgi:hypothetical protein